MSKEDSKYIWCFDDEPFFSQQAPKLLGKNGQGNNGIFSSTDGIGREITPDIEKYTYVDVSRNFSWTLNNEREEVPRVILKEMVQNKSAMITRALYYLGQASDFFKFLGVANDPLSSYEGLYITDDSGFFYDLPNLGGEYFKTGSNSFGADSNDQFFKNMLQGASNMAEGFFGGANPISSGINVAQTAGGAIAGAGELAGRVREALVGGGGGYYTEQPQFYQHGGNSRTYDISFPLFNTTSWEDVLINFQLVFMLVYQNIPNRSSKQIVMPPHIYEVTVPGISYTPYAYMSSVDIKFVGAVREINLPLPFGDMEGLKSIRVSVPEAYDVRLNLQELVGNTRNFMYHNVKRKVSTGIEEVDELIDEV